jgi:lambda family phage portal protein
MVEFGRFGMIRRTFAALRRAFSFTGGLDIAGGSTRWPAGAMLAAPMAQTLAARAIAARRIGWLVENSPTAAAIVNAYVTAIVGGDGITARANHPDKDERLELERIWQEFAADCDIEGVVNLQGLLARAVSSLVVNGEAFGRMIVDQGATLRVAFLAPEQIDATLTRPSLGLTGNAPRITAGIEQDRLGRRTAYWVRDTAPDVPWASVELPVRVPAEDICHMFEPKVPGAVRGLSWLSPVATRLIEIDALEDAVLAKCKVNALFAAFVRDLDNASGLAGDTTTDPSTFSLEPGTLRFLPPGTDVTFTPQAELGQIDAVLRHMLRTASAGCGVPYELACGDLSARSTILPRGWGSRPSSAASRTSNKR